METALDEFFGYCQFSLSTDSIEIYCPDKLVAIALRRYCKELAKWAIQFQKACIRILYPNCGEKYFEVPSHFATAKGSEGDDLEAITAEDQLEDLRVLERVIQSKLPTGIANLETDDMLWANPTLIDLCKADPYDCSHRNVRNQWEDAGSMEALEAIKRNLRQGSTLENHEYRCLLNPGDVYPHLFRTDYEVIWLPGRRIYGRLAVIREAEPLTSVVS